MLLSEFGLLLLVLLLLLPALLLLLHRTRLQGPGWGPIDCAGALRRALQDPEPCNKQGLSAFCALSGHVDLVRNDLWRYAALKCLLGAAASMLGDCEVPGNPQAA